MELDLYESPEEKAAVDQFSQQGFFIFDLANQNLLSQIRGNLHRWGCVVLDKEIPLETFFDKTGDYVTPDDLNQFRLALIQKLSADQAMRQRLYCLARKQLHYLVGNELAMQRAINLSIQLPQDTSSLLPLHSDVWSGNSPYEVVFWLPLVDCYKTRSMYLLPKPKSDAVMQAFPEYAKLDAEEFFRKVEPDAHWIDIRRGQGMIFWHGLAHGNHINQEPLARWSINVRFKSLLSPYGDKELGESFLPLTVKPLTRFGYTYREPLC